MKSILFILVFSLSTAQAYRSQGVENIRNMKQSLKEAEELGLKISNREKILKKDLQRLQKKKPEEFKVKLEGKLENSNEYQGYLYEVRDGLDKTEKAKQLAKLVLYKKVQEDWDILKTTILNNYGASNFKDFSKKMVEQLNAGVYVPAKQGFSYEVGNWGIAMVLPSLQTVRWKVQFSSKYDGNVLEEGADKIKIDDGSGKPSLNFQDESVDF